MSKEFEHVGGVKRLFGAHGFYQQYLSVMLIVLAFTIGAFLRGGPAVPGKAAAAAPQKLSEITYADLFNGEEAEPDASKIEAIAGFLASHDVKAEFELYLPRRGHDESGTPLESGPGAEAGITLALGRAVALSAYFEKAGVPRDAVAIYAVEAVRAAQARVQLYRTGGRHAE